MKIFLGRSIRGSLQASTGITEATVLCLLAALPCLLVKSEGSRAGCSTSTKVIINISLRKSCGSA